MARPIIDRWYDERVSYPWTMDYYGHSHFFNFGYWIDGTCTQKEASENLMERILAFLPDRTGTVLDVACGTGGTTSYLLKHFRPSEVAGINISRAQLERARAHVPGCSFLQMDAARLGFKEGSFDSVICVEAAFHFVSREDFLRSAYRVLKPGGRLVLSDILVHGWAARLNRRLPSRNHVNSIEEYKESYRRAGFDAVEVVDATRECWTSFYRQIRRWRREKYRTGQMGLVSYGRMILRSLMANAGLRYYLLVSARRP